MEAQGVSSNAPGTGFAGYLSGYGNPMQAITGGQNTAPAPLVFTATTDETWLVTKSYNATGSTVTPNFAVRQMRDYAAVVNNYTGSDWANTNSESAARIAYNLRVQALDTNGDGFGRVYNDKITVTDTITYPAGLAPKDITVTTNPPGNASKIPIAFTVQGSTSTSTTISFNVPDVSDAVFAPAQDFLVAVTYDKQQYTTMRNGSPVTNPPAVETVGNQADLTWFPAASYFGSNSGIAAAPSSVNGTMGWYQGEPQLPRLTIQTQLLVSGILGSERDYITKLARVYENNLALNDTDASALAFTLTPVADNSSLVPTGATISVPLTLGSTQSLAQSPALDPGWYRLKETGFSSTVLDGFSPTASDLTGDGMLVYVTDPAADPNAVAYVIVGGNTAPHGADDYTFANYKVINQSSTVGSFRVYPKQQKTGEYPSVYQNISLQLDLYDGATLIAEPANSGVDSILGSWIEFENIPINTIYQLKEHSPAAGLELASVTPNAIPADQGPGLWSGYGSVVNAVQAVSTARNTYTAYLDRNYGGFRAGKIFLDPLGDPAAEQNFVAQFKLYKTSDGTPLTSNAFDFSLDSTTVKYVDQEFPAGTYYIREVGLSLDGDKAVNNSTDNLYVSGLGKYALIGGNDIQVQIQKGSWNAAPASSTGFVTPVPSNPNLASSPAGQIVNTAIYGQLSLQNFHASGDIKPGTQFVITPHPGVPYNGGSAKTITIPTSGIWTEFVPAGQYDISPQASSAPNARVRDFTSSSVTVSASTPSAPSLSNPSYTYNSGSGFGNTGTPPAQTVAYAWDYPPFAQGHKVRQDSDNNPPSQTDISSGVVYTVWQLDNSTSTYNPYIPTGASTPVTATVGAGGIFVTNRVLEGASSPANTYICGDYLAVCLHRASPLPNVLPSWHLCRAVGAGSCRGHLCPAHRYFFCQLRLGAKQPA